ncbi:MAG: hypothetical protein V4443_09150 [Pseudomonadota bacterium]
MKKHSRHLLVLLMIGTTLLSGCAQKKDLIIDYGNGDSIRLVGGADNFDCDDPTYANVKKVHTWTMQFADGSSKFLCSTEESVAAEKAAAESTSRQGHGSSVISGGEPNPSFKRDSPRSGRTP